MMALLPTYVARSTIRIISLLPRIYPRLFQHFFALFVALAGAWLVLGLLPGLAQARLLYIKSCWDCDKAQSPCLCFTI
jgi:hypothetical protein